MDATVIGPVAALAAAEPAVVERDDPVALGQPRHQLAPTAAMMPDVPMIEQ